MLPVVILMRLVVAAGARNSGTGGGDERRRAGQQHRDGHEGRSHRLDHRSLQLDMVLRALLASSRIGRCSRREACYCWVVVDVFGSPAPGDPGFGEPMEIASAAPRPTALPASTIDPPIAPRKPPSGPPVTWLGGAAGAGAAGAVGFGYDAPRPMANVTSPFG